MGEANVINAWLAKRPILSIHSHLSSLAEAGHSTADAGMSRLRSRLEAAIYRVLMSLLFKRATVVAVADSIGKELVEHFRLPGSRVVVIPNAVDISEIQARSQEKADCPWPADIPAVITSGRLTAVKGQWHLIRAFAEASKEVPCRLVILGTGELERDLRKLVKDLGIEDQVYFMGWQDNPFKFMSRARVFVLSSLSEAFPLVLLEAMACGLPVVSADCPGEVHDLLSGGAGVLTPRLDGTMTSAATPVTPQQLRMADAIVTLLKDRSKYETCRNAGFQRVRDFDHENFVARYQRLIESTGSGR
jgi:glycosyltransferase involved in cell wall biosynthesis